jgi:hypothetical protein
MKKWCFKWQQKAFGFTPNLVCRNVENPEPFPHSHKPYLFYFQTASLKKLP